MKPLRLKMYGVGPYAKEVEIDFTRLNEEGLFLITGATGAGKTSIFDGITYALYGETNYGDEEKKNGIICDYLDVAEHRNTYVEFTFEIDQNEYTVKRIPAHYRYKKNGERNKNKEGEKLEIESSSKEKIPAKKTDMDQYLKETIVKLEISQFKKLIMLPQGAFSEFIRSNSKAKKEILEKIFETSIYDEITRALRDKVKGLGIGIYKERDRLFAKLETLGIEDSRWKELLDNKLLSFEELIKVIKGVQQSLEEENKVLTKEVKGLKIEGITAEISKGETLNKGIDELKKAKEDLVKLEERSDEITNKTEDLKRYKKAVQMKPEYAEKKRAKKDLDDKSNKYIENQNEFEKYKEDNDSKIATLEEVKISFDTLKKRVNTLELLKSDVEEYKKQVNEAEDNKIKLGNLKEKDSVESIDLLKRLEIKKVKLLDKQKEIVLKLDEAGTLKIEKERLKNKCDNLKNLVDRYSKIEVDEKEFENLEIELKNLEEGAREKLTIYRTNKDLWFQSEAYQLSTELEDGKECLVCGSTEHPKKAKKPLKAPSKKELEDFGNLYEAAKSKVDKLDGKIKNTRKSLDEANMELDKDIKKLEIDESEKLDGIYEESKNDLLEIEKKLEGMPTSKDSEKVQEELAGIEESIGDAEKVKQQIEDKIKDIKKDIDVSENRCIELKNKLDSKEVDLDEFDKEYTGTIDKRDLKAIEQNNIGDLEKNRVKMEGDLKKDKDTLMGAEKTSIKSTEKFIEKLSNTGFETEDEYIEADAVDGEKIDKEISAYNIEKSSVATRIEIKKEYQGMESVDLSELEKKLIETKVKEDKFKDQIADNSSKKNSLEERKNEIISTKEKIGSEEKILSVYKKLSDISEGKYGDKKNNITFQNYVLGVYFEEILDRANQRFSKMTSNQYEMRLHRREDSGRGEGGLDINVFDSHTGRERSIKTLSGGETFKASMALALGLSDMVQAQNGGIQLDSVFIDEGFGTLDDESLSSAMDILMELKSSGRTVGIISHVNELKQTITSQIRVEKSNRGSTVEVVF